MEYNGTHRTIKPNRFISHKKSWTWGICEKVETCVIFNRHCYFSWCVLSDPSSEYRFLTRGTFSTAQRIQELNWRMTKLKILTESSLEGQDMHLNNFWIKIDARNDGRFYCQDVKLSKHADTKVTVSTFYDDWITRISENVERRFWLSFNIACIFEPGIFAGYIDLADWWQKLSHTWRKLNLKTY